MVIVQSLSAFLEHRPTLFVIFLLGSDHGRCALKRNRIRPVLRELWNVVVSPVVDKLTELEVAKKTRIWWCPTSELSALPLHAAGPYRRGQANLPDIYISSYTSALSSLIKARSGVVRQLASPKLLMMGQPNDNLGERVRLPDVREEIRRVDSLGNFADVLVGEKADRNTVLSRLQDHPWVHFACHGRRANKPFLSIFQLHDDEQLTLIDIIKARLPNAELAFLSACHSAAIDTRGTPDESIHIAAALQFCGFRSAIGTLGDGRYRWTGCCGGLLQVHVS
jgi:CHAT domain-containing protein